MTSTTSADALAVGLGGFSLGLGLAEMLAPGALARTLGLRGGESLLRGYGAREIFAGLLTLSPNRRLGLWSRVAGDALDIGTLVPAVGGGNPKRGNAGIALAMVLGITALDVIAARRA